MNLEWTKSNPKGLEGIEGRMSATLSHLDYDA